MLNQLPNIHTNPLTELGFGTQLAKRILENRETFDKRALKKLVSILSRKPKAARAEDTKAAEKLSKLETAIKQSNALSSDEEGTDFRSTLKEIAIPDTVKALILKLQNKAKKLEEILHERAFNIKDRILEGLKNFNAPSNTKLLALINFLIGAEFDHYIFNDKTKLYHQIEFNGTREKYGLPPVDGAEKISGATGVLGFGIYSIGENGEVYVTDTDHKRPITDQEFKDRVAGNFEVSDDSIKLKSQLGGSFNYESAREFKRTNNTSELEKMSPDEIRDETDRNSNLAHKEGNETVIRLQKSKKEREKLPIRILGVIKELPLTRILDKANGIQNEDGIGDYYFSPYTETIKLSSGQNIKIYFDLTDYDFSQYCKAIQAFNFDKLANDQMILAEIEDSDKKKRLVCIGKLVAALSETDS